MTKLYFHAATRTSSGTLPTAEQSTLTSIKDLDAQTLNRSMDDTKGTAQTSIVLATNATISAQTYYFTRFVSGELKGAQTISANTWNYNYACAENNANANFPNAGTSAAPAVVAINVYVWRPSTGAKVGTILDGNTAASYWEPTAVNTETAENGTFAGASVTAADKDVIICEIWFTTTQGNATSRNDTFYFDGTTETATTGTTVSNHASYIETPQTLAFYLVRVLTETITVSDSAALHIIPATAQANVSAKKGTITLDTTSGVHDQSFTGVGFTPKALIIWGVGVTNESFNEGIVCSFGMSDGTTHGAIGIGQVDASTTNAHMIRNDAIIEQVSATTPSTVVVRASVKTFDTDGFTLTYASKTDTTAYVFHYLAIGGSDISNVKVKHETAGTTATGNASYTGTGFRPSAMIFANAFPADTVNTNATGLQLNVGAGTSGTSQFSVVNARDTSTGTGYQFNDNRVLFGQTSPFQNVKLSSALVSLDSDGYTLNHTVAPTTGLPWFYLAIKGGYWDCAVFSQKTSTGTQVTGFKYDTKPVALFLGFIDSATSNTNVSGGISTGIGAADASLNQGCTAFGDNGSGGNFPVKVSLTSAVTRAFTPVGTATSSTIDNESDINSMSVNGQFTLDWTTANATARKLGFLILTKTTAAANQNITKSLTETITISEARARQTAKIRTISQTVTIGETPSRLTAKNRALAAESVTTSPSTVSRLAGKVRATTETVTVSDSAVISFRSKVRAIVQTITIGGTPTRTKSVQRALAAESVTTTPSTVSRITGRTRTISQTVTVSDALAMVRNKIRSISQTVTIGGTVIKSKGVNRQIATQTVSISDALAIVRNKIRTIVQTVTVSDTPARQSTKNRLITQTVSVIDAVVQSRFAQKIKALTENISVSDALARRTAKTRINTETVSTTGTATRQSARQRSITQSVSIAELVNRLTARTRTLVENIGITDTISRLAAKKRINTESVSVTGTPAKQTGKQRSITQSVSVSDLINRISDKARSLVETISITDLAEQVRGGAVRHIIRTIDEARVVISDAFSITREIVENNISVSDFVSCFKTDNTPTNFAKTLTESVSVGAGIIARVGGKLRSLTETTSVAGDTAAVTVRDKKRTVSESITISDLATCTKSQRQIAKSINESVSLSGDSVNIQRGKVRRIGGTR